MRRKEETRMADDVAAVLMVSGGLKPVSTVAVCNGHIRRDEDGNLFCPNCGKVFEDVRMEMKLCGRVIRP